MKRLFAGIAACVLLCTAAVGFAACEKEKPSELNVYAPDGAPALALLNAIAEEEKLEESNFDFDIVSADTIVAKVTGNNPVADICVLPVNAAAKVLGKGTVYQMLGTVTQGNLFFLSTGETALTKENLKTELTGKKVGVVQLGNVPGLTLRAVLGDYEASYQVIESVQAEAAADKVNLVALKDATEVTPAFGCDYYLCPEPAATTKVKGTASAPKPLHLAGDLQKLYGKGNGYPQAAVVAKKSVITDRAADLNTFLGYLKGSENFLKTVTPETVLHLLEEEREDGLQPTFNAQNLNATVIANCSVRFIASEDCKAQVTAFLQKLIGVQADSTALPQDAFFYMG